MAAVRWLYLYHEWAGEIYLHAAPTFLARRWLHDDADESNGPAFEVGPKW